MNKTWNKMMKEYMATPQAYWMLGWPQNMDHSRCFLANTSEGNRALKDKRKGQWNQFYFQNKTKNILKNLEQSQTISNNLKNLKISQNFSNVVSQTWFCETGFFIAYFSGPQKISKNLKQISKSFRFAGKKPKKKRKQEKNKIKLNKLMQTYKKPWTISAILALFPQAVICYFLQCILLQPDSV